MIWAEKLPVYRVLSRDCRYDSTKEWICIVNKNRGLIKKYFLNKKRTRLMYQGPIPIDILDKGIVCTGTCTYELQEEIECLDYTVKSKD